MGNLAQAIFMSHFLNEMMVHFIKKFKCSHYILTTMPTESQVGLGLGSMEPFFVSFFT